MLLTRRHVIGSLAAAGATLAYGPARAAKPYDPPGSLIDAARKEGGFTLFSATFPDVQQEVINLFNKAPPVSNQSGYFRGFDQSVDATGRYVYVDVSYAF